MPPPTDLKSISDVVLRISRNNDVPVNSDVLRSVSTYFEGIFGAARAQKGRVHRIDPFHFKSSNFEKCMKIVHGVTLEHITDFEDIKECLLISDEFDLPHVQRMCQKYLNAIQGNDIDKYLFSVKYGMEAQQWKNSVNRKVMDDWLKEPNRNGSVDMITFSGTDLYSELMNRTDSHLHDHPKMLPTEIGREAVDRSTRIRNSKMDAILEKDGVEIPVKKQLLCVVSPVFKEAFDIRGEPNYYLSKDGSRVTRLKIDDKFDPNALLTCMEIVHGCRDMIDKSSLETLEQILLVTRHFELPHVEEMVAGHMQGDFNLRDLCHQYCKLDVYLFACKHDLCDGVKIAILGGGVLSDDMTGWWTKKRKRGEPDNMPYTLNTSDVKRLLASVRVRPLR